MRSRFVVALLLALACFHTALATKPNMDELLALEGDAFFAALEPYDYQLEESFSTEELFALADKLSKAGRGKIKNFEQRFFFARIFGAACKGSSEEQLPRMIDLFVAADPDVLFKESALEPLAAAWIARYLAAHPERKAVEFPPIDEAAPAKLTNASPELVSAWQLFRRVSEPYARSFPEEDADRRPINFQANERSFYKLVGEILQGRGDGSAEELARYEWSGGCGTGAESLTRPQSLAMFIALLNEKRIPEAVGAALRFESGVPILSADGRVARLEFFEACGLDWETLLVGAQAATFADVPFYGWSWKSLEELASHGSERAAELVLELAQHADKESHSRYAGALTGFLPPRPAGEDGSYRVSSDEISRRNELALSPATRARIVAALEKIAVPEARNEVVEAALAGLGRALSAESKPTLRALAGHPSREIAKTAAGLLRELGEGDAPVNSEPVRFQVSINGTPVPAGAEISWEVQFEDGGRVSSTHEADAAGTIELKREYLADPRRKASAVVFSGSYLKSGLEEPYFVASFPVPANLDQVVPVNIPLLRAELRIERLQGYSPGASDVSLVKLERHEPTSDISQPYEYFDRRQRKSEVPLGAATALTIQKGTYDLEVVAPARRSLSAPSP